MREETKEQVLGIALGTASMVVLEMVMRRLEQCLKPKGRQQKCAKRKTQSSKRRYLSMSHDKSGPMAGRPDLRYTPEELKAAKKMVTVVEHSLITDKVTRMRDKNTPSWNMRQLAREVAQLLCFKATEEMTMKPVEVETPLCRMNTYKLKYNIVSAPIIRGGLAMEDGLAQVASRMVTAHLGMYRDEVTLKPHPYFRKFPPCEEQTVLVCDPMLATGGSAILAIQQLKEQGFKDIRMLSIFAAPEGIVALHKAHPDIKIFVCTIEDGLDENGYIVPGCGDAGDRIFGAV